MSTTPDSPKPLHDNQDRPGLDNVIHQVNLIQEQSKRQREKKVSG